MSEQDNSGVTGFGIVGFIILLALGWLIYNAWIKPESWQGFYETTFDNVIHATGKFDSREQCAEWLRAGDTNGSYNRECGSGCEPPTTAIGPYRCKETFN